VVSSGGWGNGAAKRGSGVQRRRERGKHDMNDLAVSSSRAKKEEGRILTSQTELEKSSTATTEALSETLSVERE
jgi:hypothetical protein